jgi:hypothetical protein
MGFLFKSAIGLGAVYFAMFGQALRSDGAASTASLCASAATERLAGDSTLRAQWRTAGCAVAAAGLVERATPAPVAAPHAAVAAPAIAPPPAREKPRFGALTEADLAEPWFGPARIPRKAARRG